MALLLTRRAKLTLAILCALAVVSMTVSWISEKQMLDLGWSRFNGGTFPQNADQHLHRLDRVRAISGATFFFSVLCVMIVFLYQLIQGRSAPRS